MTLKMDLVIDLIKKVDLPSFESSFLVSKDFSWL